MDTAAAAQGRSLLLTLFSRYWYWPIAGIAIFWLYYLLYQIFLSPLARVPGPLAARISRLWLVYHGWKGDFHDVLIDLHARYGDVVRTGPRELSIADPETVRQIYGFGSKFEKSNWYSVTHGTRKFDLFAESREDVHRVQRRVVNNVYSVASLKELEPGVDSAISHFLNILRQKQGVVLDLGMWIQLFAFDVIGEVTFSRRFGLMDAGVESDVLKEIKRSLKSTSWVSQIPIIYHLHEALKPALGDRLAATARNGSVRQFTATHVRARQARAAGETNNNKDIYQRLVDVHTAKPEQFGLDDVVSMSATNVFAGSDTTAVSLRAMMYFLLKHPECKAKLVKEVDSFFESSSTGDGSEVVTFSAANNMPYLQAVMYEALRLHPVVGQTLPRVAPQEGLQAGNHFIPQGTTVGASPFVMGLRKDIFGDDAAVFRPERWLEGPTGEMQRFWLPFGGGSRTCIGKNLSWIEMSKLLPTLFHHFDIQLADPRAEWSLETYFFVLQSGLNVVLQPRKN